MPEEELYDLATDPHEITNLALSPEHGETLRRLRTALERWIEERNNQGRQLKPEELARRKGVTKPETNLNAGCEFQPQPAAVSHKPAR